MIGLHHHSNVATIGSYIEVWMLAFAFKGNLGSRTINWKRKIKFLEIDIFVKKGIFMVTPPKRPLYLHDRLTDVGF